MGDHGRGRSVSLFTGTTPTPPCTSPHDPVRAHYVMPTVDDYYFISYVGYFFLYYLFVYLFNKNIFLMNYVKAQYE